MMVEGLQALPGEKKKILLSVKENTLELPVTLIQGTQPGETILITSGIHCTEYTGIEAAIELAQELTPDKIKGRVILVHPVNINGFEACQMNANVPEDNKNLNRVFPGNKDGTVSEQLADYIVRNLHAQGNYYIDMHGGNIQEDLAAYVYYVTITKPEVCARAREMANHIQVDYKVGSKVGSQGSYNYAGACGIPSILIERGCKGVWTKHEVEIYKEDVKNVMRYLGILEDSVQETFYNPYNIETVCEIDASVTGCWYPTKKAGDKFKEGELAGEIKDYFGKMLEQIYFKEDGIILYQTCSLCIGEKQNIITYGVLE